MLRKLLLAPLVLSLASLLTVADSAQAQRRGGGFRGRVGISRGYRGGFNRGFNRGFRGRSYAGYRGYYPYRNYGYGLGGYGGYGYGLGGYGLGGYGLGGLLGYGLGYGGLGYGGLGYGGLGYGGYGGYYGNSGYYPSYYSYPTSSYSYPISSNYYAPAVNSYAVNSTPASAQSANVRVLVPNPNAQVWFDGTKTQQNGTDRTYHTPPLKTGAANEYHVRAEWKQGNQQVIRERDVHVEPGQNALVDFVHSN